MNWKIFWNTQAQVNDPRAQVGRQVSGSLHADDLMDKIADKIATQIQLKMSDDLLDVCCGNGILTRKLAVRCNSVSAIDFSEVLIANARTEEIDKITWYCDDAYDFNLEKRFDKILLYFSFQYFETNEKAEQVIECLTNHLKPGGIILLGDIPDAAYKWTYYDTPLKRFFAIWSQLKGKNNMGRFWKKESLVKICEKHGLTAEIHSQENWQPYAWYRFDLLAYSKK
ncbi:MAG: class I SAM-dependent methyltransferase [Bacteroidia bacterium]